LDEMKAAANSRLIKEPAEVGRKKTGFSIYVPELVTVANTYFLSIIEPKKENFPVAEMRQGSSGSGN
jgi:hypothetical protein